MFTYRFWRRLIILASGLVLGSLVLGALLMSNSASTQAATQAVAKSSAGQCSNATLKGTYVFANDGYQITASDRVPFAEAGNGVYDGKGHVQGLVSVSTNGQITRLSHYTGTYTVNPDCTVTETDTTSGGTLHFDEFVRPDGSLFTLVETDPGVVASGSESRGTGK